MIYDDGKKGRGLNLGYQKMGIKKRARAQTGKKLPKGI